jgi:hypothetical protein
MPKRPKAAGDVGEGSVVRVLCEEVAIVGARCSKSRGRWVKCTLLEVDLKEIPAGTEGIDGGVRDKKEAIGGCRNSSKQVGTRSRRRWEGAWISRVNDGNGSVGRDGDNSRG